MRLVDHIGGRKTAMCFAFLACTTLLTYKAMQRTEPDLIGLSTVIGAIAAGVGALVWGNVKEHQAQK